MIKEPHLKVHYRMRIPTIRSWIVQVTPKDIIIKYHTEGSACRIENVRLDSLKSGLNMDKLEEDIEEDREGRLKDWMDEKSVIKTVPKCKNTLRSEMDQGPYKAKIALVNGCCSSILNILFSRV